MRRIGGVITLYVRNASERVTDIDGNKKIRLL